MIDRGAVVRVKCQAELLELTRSNVYYRPRPVSERDLLLMRRLDELHLEAPYYGARKLAAQLRREATRASIPIRLMSVPTCLRPTAGPQAAHQHPGPWRLDLSVPAGEARHRAAEPSVGERHYVCADGAWVFVPDGDHRPLQPQGARLGLSNTLTSDFCVEALEEALAKFGSPEIFNTDQRNQSSECKRARNSRARSGARR
jgi:putative transposase